MILYTGNPENFLPKEKLSLTGKNKIETLVFLF